MRCEPRRRSSGDFFWSLRTGTSPAGLNHLLSIWFAVSLVVAIVVTVWVEIRRKQLVTLQLRARPMKLPDFLHQSELASWPVCYQPSAPMLMLQGSRGYSLNLANTLAHLGAAYLIGLIALFVMLPVGR
jgi:Na+/serine symporter